MSLWLRYCFLSRACIFSPISAGESQTVMPAAFIAAILSDALPDPPEMIAPAWPMRRPGRRCLSGDEADDRLLHVRLDVLGRGLFRIAADFADHDDRFRVRIFVEELDRIDEGGADDRIAADADAGRLADAELRQLTDGLIRQRAGAGHDADICPAL